MARAVLDALFPWACLLCRSPADGPVCGLCFRRVRWISGPACPHCGLALASGPDHLCDRCRSRPPAFRRARSLAAYGARDEEQDPIGAWIRAVKYGKRRPLAAPLGVLLAERFPYDPQEFDCVIPVPLHLARLRERGFNQALLLAREPARRFGLELAPLALVRTRGTSAQAGLPLEERRRNVRDAFGLRPGSSVARRRVLLVDDVATSMATADACARALVAADARSVDVLTVARTL